MKESKFEIHHWGANMPPIKTRFRGNITKREAHFRQALIALALAGLLIGGAALAVLEIAEGARKEQQP